MRGFLLGVAVGVVFGDPILATLAQGVATVGQKVQAELGRADPWMAIKEPPLEPAIPPISSAVTEPGERPGAP